MDGVSGVKGSGPAVLMVAFELFDAPLPWPDPDPLDAPLLGLDPEPGGDLVGEPGVAAVVEPACPGIIP